MYWGNGVAMPCEFEDHINEIVPGTIRIELPPTTPEWVEWAKGTG